MNQRIKFLELVLGDLVSERDTYEMDLNHILNLDNQKTQKKKEEFIEVLDLIVKTNNKIKTLSEYISTLAPTPEFKGNNED